MADSHIGPILLVGKSGQLGWELRRTLTPLGYVRALGREELDLCQPDNIRSRVREIAPSLIVNAAAYTAVDRAEEEPDLAMSVNGAAPGIFAEEAKRLGIAFVHYSTDYVFYGQDTSRDAKRSPRAYREGDAPNPLSVYGKTKLAGEEAIRSVNPDHLILRTSWIYSLRRRNFLLSILDQAKEKRELVVVDDQIGSPTWARMIAEATAQILTKSWDPQTGSCIADKAGLYHLSASGQTSWHGFAEAIVERARKLRARAIRVERVRPISSDQLSMLARRPHFSVLDNSTVCRTFGISLPPWELQLELCLDA